MKTLLQKKWTFIVVFLFAGWYANAQTATAPAGTGTSGDPYQIATLENLYWVTQNTACWATGNYFIQTADIDALTTTTWDGGAGFSPIGNGTTYFSGHYEGEKHIISNLFIDRPNTYFISLFGFINGAEIFNLAVTNVNFTGKDCVGGLIGAMESKSQANPNPLANTVSNCYSTGTVKGDDYVGGLCGYTGGNSIISNSYSRVSVSGDGTAWGFIGGLVGLHMNASIENSYSTGLVTGNQRLGGFVGRNNNGFSPANEAGTATNCFWDKLTSNQTSSDVGTGKSTAEMKTQATFTGWDFTTIWEISSGVNDGYPAFQPDSPNQPMQLKFTTTADNRSIRLPLYGTVDCTVDWGDGSPVESFNTPGRKQHIFATAGTYTVSISGSLTQFGYYDTGNEVGWSGAGYLSEVVDFGSVGLTSLSGAFCDADNLSSVPAALPATVTDLSYCFYLNGKASITNLNMWDVGNVTTMSDAFLEASAFNQDISTWDVSGVTNMENLFKRASAFNQDISTWDVSSVTNMEDLFREADAFNQPIGIWDVSSVTTMEGMFETAAAFNQDISNWNVGSVTTMSSMFDWATSFNQDISDWDVMNVTDMSWMFSGATEFDQSLAGWDIGSVTTMEDMFMDVTLSTANYDSILTAWAAQPVQSNVVFNGGNSQYSAGAAATARGVLTGATNNWIITDGGQVFTVTTEAASTVAATTATGNGTIVSVGSGNATNRGVIYYPYSGTDKIIGDADVTNVSENGDFGAAAFTASLTGLSVNARYNARAHATNTDDGTKYGARVDFWTTARVPSAPNVINPTATSLDVVVNPNGNPAGVLFAIQDSANALYVQANGTRTTTVVWQTVAQWDTTQVTDLSTGVTYYFRVKAKNDNNDTTAFGLSTGQNTCSNPTEGGEIGSDQTICEGSTPEKLTNEEDASNYGGTLEYKWQFSTTSDTEGFDDINPVASGEDYSPGALTDTTWFKRLARVDCKPDWTGAVESNVIMISTAPRPVANAGADASIVEGETYTLADASAENYTGVSWTTDGDGSFNNEISLKPVYTPGDDDIDAGSVELCLSSAPVSPCAVDSTDCITLTIWRHPTVSITSPLQKAVLYANPVTISGTASDADDNLSIIEVKLNAGTWQTATGTTSWTISLNLEPGKNTLEARAKDATNLYSDTASVAVTLSVQVISIPQGWSYISSYLEPTDPDVVNMWADIVGANHLSILTGVNGIYAPAPFYINTLQNWDYTKGYKVKMHQADELIISGDSLADKTVTFPAGVHLVPVLTNQTTGLDMVFDNPETDILYLLDIYSNQVYWPGGGLNSLTDLVPGKGYLANFKNQVTLTYPPLADFTVNTDKALPPAEGPWACTRTSNYHLISVSAEAVKDLPNADFLGAFNSQGNCVGYAAIEKSGQNILLTIYGDEPMTEENDGITEGELLHFRSFSINDNSEKELTATFNPTFPNNDRLFYTNGLSGISGFKESATGVGENDLAASVLVYPNPATDVVNIVVPRPLTVHEASGLSGVEGNLLTTEGKPVKTFTITSPETQLDVSDLHPGIYLLKIASSQNIVIKRVVIQ